MSANFIPSSNFEFLMLWLIISYKNSLHISMCSLRCLAETLLAGFDFLVFKALISPCILVKPLSLNEKVEFNSNGFNH